MPFDGTNLEQQDGVLYYLMRGRERVARPGGWTKYYFSEGNATCAIGALMDANADTWSEICLLSGVEHAMELLKTAVPDGRTVMSYNDDPLRTQDDIVVLYDRAIALRLAELQE